MGFSLKHDNQTPTLKREYNKYSEVLVSKISLFYSSSKLQTPSPFQHNEQGQHVRIGQKNGCRWELVPGKQGGMEALHQLVLRTHYALRATHYVALRTTCKQAGSRAGGGAGIDRVVSEQAASSQATDRWGGGYQGGTRRVPRGAPTNLTVTRR